MPLAGVGLNPVVAITWPARRAGVRVGHDFAATPRSRASFASIVTASVVVAASLTPRASHRANTLSTAAIVTSTRPADIRHSRSLANRGVLCARIAYAPSEMIASYG